MLQHTKTTRKGTGIIKMIEHKEHFHGSDLEKIEKIYGISKENIINFAANVNPLGESAKLKDAYIRGLTPPLGKLSQNTASVTIMI